MDMRFAGLDRDRSRRDPAPIDYRCFVATLAAEQVIGATARAAAAARAAHAHAARPTRSTLLRMLDEVSPSRPSGAFHRAAGAPVQRSASKLKEPFTLAFQPSFKPADL